MSVGKSAEMNIIKILQRTTQCKASFVAVFLEFRDKVINTNGTFVTCENQNSSQFQFSTLHQVSQIIMNVHADTSLSNPSKQAQERIDAKDDGATSSSTPIADSQQQIDVEDDEDAYSESSFISEDEEIEHVEDK